MNLKVRFIYFTISDNERKHMIRSKFTIFPENPFKTGWDCVGFIFIVCQSIAIPFHLCFGTTPEGALFILDIIIDIFFMADISKTQRFNSNVVVNFNCGYYKKDVLVMNRKDIIFNYLKTWFVLDLVASFPYSWVIDYEEADEINTEESAKSIFKTP